MERNPWSYLPNAVLREHALLPAQGAGAPGPFALGDAARLRALVEDAGFQEVRIDAIDLEEVHPDFDSFWETRLDLSRGFHDLVLSQEEALISRIRDELAERLAPYTDSEGRLTIPGRVLVPPRRAPSCARRPRMLPPCSTRTTPTFICSTARPSRSSAMARRGTRTR